MHNAVWKKCLEIIKNTLPEEAFVRWFQPIVPHKIEQNVLTLQVTSEYCCEWIEENYLEVLKKALFQVMGEAAQLRYVVRAEPQPMPVLSADLPATPLKHGDNHEAKQEAAVHFQNAHQTNLNTRYVFDSFVRMGCNQQAYEVAQAAAQKPGKTVFNPLMIYGKVGLGKTHLLQALAQKAQGMHESLRVICMSGEQFLSQFVHASRHNVIDTFCENFLQADALLLDDIQFLCGKEKTQDFFFHLFNHLHQRNKQLVFTSDTPPAKLEGMHDRLISRLRWGLTVELSSPDSQERETLLRAKAAAQGLALPDEICEYVAAHVLSSIREIEAVVISIVAHKQYASTDLSLEAVQQIVGRIVSSVKPLISLEVVHQTTAAYFEIEPNALLSATRTQTLTRARHLAIYLSRQYTQHGTQRIGNYFNRDHTTILYALKTIEAAQKTDLMLKKQLSELHERLGAS